MSLLSLEWSVWMLPWWIKEFISFKCQINFWPRLLNGIQNLALNERLLTSSSAPTSCFNRKYDNTGKSLSSNHFMESLMVICKNWILLFVNLKNNWYIYVFNAILIILLQNSFGVLLRFLCNYLWNLPAASEWKLYQSKSYTIFCP